MDYKDEYEKVWKKEMERLIHEKALKDARREFKKKSNSSTVRELIAEKPFLRSLLLALKYTAIISGIFSFLYTLYWSQERNAPSNLVGEFYLAFIATLILLYIPVWLGRIVTRRLLGMHKGGSIL